MTPKQFGLFWLGVFVAVPLLAAGTKLARAQSAPPTTLVECPALLSSDKTIEIARRAPSADRCATPEAVVTRANDLFVGLACESKDGKMACSAFKPTDVTPDPEISNCVSDFTLTKSGEMQISVWSVKGSCTPNPLTMIPHRVVRIGIMGGTICLSPGESCASIKTLLPEGQQRLVQMGFGGLFQRLFEEMIGKPDEQRG